jgi:hypothetical protein
MKKKKQNNFWYKNKTKNLLAIILFILFILADIHFLKHIYAFIPTLFETTAPVEVTIPINTHNPISTIPMLSPHITLIPITTTKYTYTIKINNRSKPVRGIVLNPEDAGKQFELPVNSIITINCKICHEQYHSNSIEIFPSKGIIEAPQLKNTELPASNGVYTVASFNSINEGTAKIILTVVTYSSRKY